ncbi:GMC family oxidoreductase [Labrys monachus]|uniref:Choline dehydrogenase n=1 Tax=Labrys monachus TaxID=217067 RepID=A0ABU0FP52_9HYPH|nr:GMC family oxidoreductase N-terminal domain-containing protein [Labrys monachus]MDQ0395853.1 choline dehydrogenase [Labrys monachus]
MGARYDYIIVGGGSAGCVVATRLVRDHGARVLLVEAGRRDGHPLMRMPAAFVKLLDRGTYVTRHETTPQAQLGGRVHQIPQARVLGGGSTVNGMVYMRGRPSDYDEWNATVGGGWGYADILPHFRAQEDNDHFFNAAHGTGGPLKVSDVRHTCETSRIFVKTLQGMGHRYNPDFNSGEQRGVGFMQTTIDRDGRRSSATTAFLSQVMRDPRLTVLSETTVTRVLFDGRRAIGVEVAQGGRRETLHADREIILAAGAYVSPKLLMLSGIGPADQLRAHGIEVLVDAPGVGENLQDHHEVPVIAQAQPGFGYFHGDTGLRMLANGLQYVLFGTGPVNSIGCDVCAYVNPDRDAADESVEPSLQFYCIPAVYLDRDVTPIADVPGVTLHSCLVRPKARGTVRLRSADPFALPLVDPNYLGHPDDMRLSVAGLRFARRVFQAAPMRDIYLRELLPGADVVSDEALAAHCRRTVKTNYHPVGTCRMGRDGDPMAVLTPDLRVRGVEGLRVVDASFFPNLVCGNTNAPVLAAADRAVAVMMGETRPAPTEEGVTA